MKARLLILSALLSLSLFASAEGLYRGSERARSLYEQGKAEEAAKLYKELVSRAKEGPVRSILNYDLGTSLLKAGDPSGAADAFFAGLGSIPEQVKPRMLYNLAHALVASGRRDEALSNLREAVTIKPDFEEAKLLYEWILKQKPPEPPPPEDQQQPPPPPPPMLEDLPPPPPDMLQDELEQNPDPQTKPW